MRLQENIDRIKGMMKVINEDNSKKDLSPIIRDSLNSIVERNKDIICNIEVIAPWNRETIEPNKSFEHYKVLITFIGGQGSKYFPETPEIQDKYYYITDEIWDVVYGYFDEAIDIYTKKIKNC